MKPVALIKRWLRRLLFLSVALLCVLAVAVGVMQTSPAKQALATLLSDFVANNSGYSLRIEGVAGVLPHNFRIASLTVADRRGDVVSLHNLEVEITLFSLLRGPVHVKALTLDHLEVWQRPLPQEHWRIPRVPGLSAFPAIDLLRVDRVTLDAAVVGAPASLALEGYIKTVEGQVFPEIELDLRGLNATGVQGLLQYTADGGMPQLLVAIQDEQLLPALLEVTPPVSINVEGKGARTDWNATVNASTGDATLIEGSAHLAEAETVSFQTAIQANIGAVPFMSDYVPMLGNEITVNATGALDRQGVLHIEPVALASETTSLALNGTLNFEQASVDLALSANYDNVARFSHSLPQELQLPLQLEATLEGAFVSPEILLDASLAGESLLTGAVQLGMKPVLAAQGTLQVTPPVLLRSIVSLTPEDRADISFAVSYAEETGALEVSEIKVAGLGVHAALRGRLTPETPACDMELSFAAKDLSLLAVLLPLPLSGGVNAVVDVKADGAHIETTLTANMDALQLSAVQLASGRIEASGQWDNWFSTSPENISAKVNARTEALHIAPLQPMDVVLDTQFTGATLQELQLTSLSLTDGNSTLAGTGTINAVARTGNGHFAGTLSDLTMLPDAVAALAGEGVDFDTNIVIGENRVELQTLQLTGDTFSADGNGSYDWSAGTLQSEVTVALPDLQGIGKAIDKPIAGAITLTAATEGALPNLSVTAQVKGDGLRYATGPPLQMLLDVAVSDVPATLAATLSGKIEGGGTSVSLYTNIALEEGVVVVAPFTMSSGANQITGHASWPLKEGSPEAQMDATLADINALAALVGYDVSGQGEATVTINQENAKIIATAHSLQCGNMSLEKMTSKLVVSDLWQTPSGKLSVDVHNLEAGLTTANHIAITGQGDMGDVELTATVSGKIDGGTNPPHPFACDAVSRISFTERNIEVGHLEGNLGDFPFRIESMVNAAVATDGFHVEPLTLRIGEGAVRAELRNEAKKLQGSLKLEKIPLALSSLFANPSVTGLLDGSIVLSGTVEQPEIETTLSVSQARLDLETAEELAPLDAALNARLAEGQLDASFDAAMEGIVTVGAKGSLPLLLQLQPLKMELPASAPVSGTVEYTVFSSPILQALGVIEHQLDAQLTGQFSFGGSIGALKASGDAYIRDGHYANVVAGTQLKNITLHIQADGTVLRIIEGTAVAGNNGKINATGEVQLLPAQSFPFTVQVEFTDAALAQLDYLNGRINGALLVEGGLTGASVSGDLLVGPVYVSMPDQLPVSEPTVLEVVEVKDGEIVEKETASSSKSLPEVKLDIRCDIPGRVYVRAPIIDSEWGGKLHIGGLATAPILEGRVAALRGHLEFLGRRFQLRDSAFSFPGGAPSDLWLDMRATAETQAIKSQVRLTGELSEVKLELSSEPPLPQDEVLAQVLFGRDLSRISPIQAIQLARVAAMFNKGLAGLQFFSGNIGVPGIDRIDLRTGERADETVVGVGKYFTDSVYVEVEQGTTSDSSKVSVEVEVTPDFSVKGDVDAKERSGVGLFWNKDY